MLKTSSLFWGLLPDELEPAEVIDTVGARVRGDNQSIHILESLENLSAVFLRKVKIDDGE